MPEPHIPFDKPTGMAMSRESMLTKHKSQHGNPSIIDGLTGLVDECEGHHCGSVAWYKVCT